MTRDLFSLRHPEDSSAQRSLRDALREHDKPRADDFDTVSDERMRIDAARLAHQAQRFAELWPTWEADRLNPTVDVAAKTKRVHARIEQSWREGAKAEAQRANEQHDHMGELTQLALMRVCDD